MPCLINHVLFNKSPHYLLNQALFNKPYNSVNFDTNGTPYFKEPSRGISYTVSHDSLMCESLPALTT